MGPSALSDRELLALVIGVGSAGRNVISTAEDILDRVGSFPGLLSMTSATLQEIPAIGPATAGRLAAAIEMWRRAEVPVQAPKLSNSESFARIVLPMLMHHRDEQLLLLVTDRTLRVLDTVVNRTGFGSASFGRTDYAPSVSARVPATRSQDA